MWGLNCKFFPPVFTITLCQPVVRLFSTFLVQRKFFFFGDFILRFLWTQIIADFLKRKNEGNLFENRKSFFLSWISGKWGFYLLLERIFGRRKIRRETTSKKEEREMDKEMDEEWRGERKIIKGNYEDIIKINRLRSDYILNSCLISLHVIFPFLMIVFKSLLYSFVFHLCELDIWH